MMLPCARSAWSWSSHKLISNWLTPVTHHTLLCQHSKRKSKSLFLLQRQCYVICWSWQLADDWGTWFGGKKHTLSIIADLCHVSHTAAHVWFQATGLESHFLRLAACSKVAALCWLLELGNWQVSEPQDKLWFWLKDTGENVTSENSRTSQVKKDDLAVQKWRRCVAAGWQRRGRFPVGVMVRSQDGRRHHHDNSAALNEPDHRRRRKRCDDDMVDSSNPHEL